MQQALLIPASMFSGGTGQSYALGTSQNSIHNKLLSSIRNSVCRTIIKDFVSDLVRFNFPQRAHNNTMGYFEAELLNTEDKTNVVKQYEAMRACGLTGPTIINDINKYRQLVGDSELSEKEIKELQKELEKMNMKPKDTTGKTDVKSTDSHYKKQNNLPKGGSSS